VLGNLYPEDIKYAMGILGDYCSSFLV